MRGSKTTWMWHNEPIIAKLPHYHRDVCFEMDFRQRTNALAATGNGISSSRDQMCQCRRAWSVWGGVRSGSTMLFKRPWQHTPFHWATFDPARHRWAITHYSDTDSGAL